MLGRLASVLGLAVAGVVAACAAPEDVTDERVDGYTVGSGYRFVVSAKPDEVVVLRRVGLVPFPFGERALVGKAVLVHPVRGRADDGVYARVLSVDVHADRYVLHTRPLSLEEMEAIPEDEVVRVYVDPERDVSRWRRFHPIAPQSVGELLAPTPLRARSGEGWFDAYRFDRELFVGLGRVGRARPGVLIAHELRSASFEPDVLLEWSRENGLALGLRGTLTWSSALSVEGAIADEVFRSPSVSTPPVVVTVPIGPVPVPITLRARAHVGCYAVVAGVGRWGVDVDAGAEVGGSLYVRRRASEPSSTWVREGPWPARATGRLTATSRLEAAPTRGVLECALPRIDVDALLAGLAGPFLGLAPVVSLNIPDGGASARVDVFAGLGEGLSDGPPPLEARLYQWRP